MMKLYVSLLSRNYDIFSGFDIRLAAQPVVATFSFGGNTVCFHATTYAIHAHTFPFSLFLAPCFNVFCFQHRCQPDFRRDYTHILYCLSTIIRIYWCIYSLEARIAFTHARSLAFISDAILVINQIKWNIKIGWLIFRVCVKILHQRANLSRYILSYVLGYRMLNCKIKYLFNMSDF